MEKQKRKEYKYKDLNEMCWDLKQNPPKRTKGEKKLISKRLKMSLADNKTGELWRSFMPRRKEITNNLTSDLISMAVYQPGSASTRNQKKKSGYLFERKIRNLHPAILQTIQSDQTKSNQS